MAEITGYREPRVDSDLCMGSGQCVYYAPNTFDLDDDNVSVVINPRGDSAETIEAAVAACPARALSLASPSDN